MKAGIKQEAGREGSYLVLRLTPEELKLNGGMIFTDPYKVELT